MRSKIRNRHLYRLITPVSALASVASGNHIEELADSQCVLELPLLVGFLRRPVYHMPEELITGLIMKGHYRNYLRFPDSVQSISLPMLPSEQAANALVSTWSHSFQVQMISGKVPHGIYRHPSAVFTVDAFAKSIKK